MCKLPFTVQMKSNAEHMSPTGNMVRLSWFELHDLKYILITGKVPFIRANDMIVAELENIVKFVNEKVSMNVEQWTNTSRRLCLFQTVNFLYQGITLTENLVEDQKCDMQSLICMVNKNFLNAEVKLLNSTHIPKYSWQRHHYCNSRFRKVYWEIEIVLIINLFFFQLYVVWLDKVTYNQMTCPRYGCVYPWPLNLVLTWQKKKQVSKILSAAEWNYKSLENVRLFAVWICLFYDVIYFTWPHNFLPGLWRSRYCLSTAKWKVGKESLFF